MSYLLDALKKSEMERKVGEVPSISTGLPAAQSTGHKSRFRLLVTALILLNAVTLGYLALPRADRPDTTIPTAEPAPQPATPDPASQPPASSQPVKPPAIPRPPAVSSNLPQPAESKNKVPEPASVIAAPEVPPPPKPAIRQQKPRPRPPVVQKKTEPVVERTAPKPPGALRSRPRAPVVEKPLKRVVQPAQPVPPSQPEPADYPAPRPIPPEALAAARQSAPEAVVPPAQKQDSGIPYLSAMPRDFQRQVPSININVFVHSDAAEERFVIIDMVKYRQGDQLPGGLRISGIDADNLVLEYRGKKFRIERP